jgi:ribulose-phosphate 3-epimerase
MVCKSLIDYGITNPIDVHLMVEPVDDLIKMFADSGASSITFHPEASKDVENSLQLIEDLGCKPGLVINPDISLEVLDPYISNLYMVLLMSVFPGFGGQEYIPEVTKKISSLRKKIDCLAKDIRLEIDGGVKEDNISEISAAGADTFVAGSAIFNKPDYKDAIENLKNNLS